MVVFPLLRRPPNDCTPAPVECLVGEMAVGADHEVQYTYGILNLRNLPEGMSSFERCEERRRRIEREFHVGLSALSGDPEKLGCAEERNCEQMFGQVPIPVGLAGPLRVRFSSGEQETVYFPLATTEGALVASVNRGCKAVSRAGGVNISSSYHGITRSLAFKIRGPKSEARNRSEIQRCESDWKNVGEATSSHLKILSYGIDVRDEYVFLTIACDTDEAMGMNMVTVASDAIGRWIAASLGCEFITVAGNVDSDKKPSRRTRENGRGYEVIAKAKLGASVIEHILKSTPEALSEVAYAKLDLGSEIAGTLGKNLHAANVIAAVYLATGQDAAHTVEGSLGDTTVRFVEEVSGDTPQTVSERPLCISTRLPALLVGIRGGGTTLPAQSQALSLLLKPRTSLHPCRQLAECIGAAVLAGEVSLLAAQASHELARAHVEHSR